MPGGMIKVSDFVIVSVPFERRVSVVFEVGAGGPKRKESVLYFFRGSWLDAKSLLQRWQPWLDVTVESFSSNAIPAHATARRA